LKARPNHSQHIWRAVVGDRLQRQWYLFVAWFGMAPLSLFSAITSWEQLLPVNAVIAMMGIPLMLFVLLRDYDFDTLAPFLPVEKHVVGRVRWVHHVVLVPLIVAFSSILVTGFDILTSGDLPLLAGLCMVFVTTFCFLGTYVWLLHPPLKRYVWLTAPVLWGLWIFLPLNPVRWNLAAWLLVWGCFLAAITSFFAAPTILGEPRRDLLSSRLSRSLLERFLRRIEAAEPRRLLWQWLQSYWKDLLLVGPWIPLTLVFWFAGLIPLVITLCCVGLILPIKYALPIDVSVMRTLPVGALRYTWRLVRRYAVASGILIGVALVWDMSVANPRTFDHFMIAASIAGYGFLVRVALWRTKRGVTRDLFVFWFLFLLGLVAIAQFDLNFWTPWLRHVPLWMPRISPHGILLGLGVTSPIALLAGAAIFFHTFTRNVAMYKRRSALTDEESLNWG
jgi:hypothetical protein